MYDKKLKEHKEKQGGLFLNMARLKIGSPAGREQNKVRILSGNIVDEIEIPIYDTPLPPR